MCIYGEGIAKDEEAGMSWINKAAENGSIDAMEALAIAYEQGLYGCEKDDAKSLYWKEKASIEQNNTE